MSTRKVLLRVALALAAALPVSAVAVAAAPAPAMACYPDPVTEKCVPPPPWSHQYQVTGVDSQGLAVQSVPHVHHVVRRVGNGTTLTVACQVNDGDQVDGRTQYGHAFRTWDQLTDGTFVYDWYMTTPTVATDGYSPGIPHCPTSNPIPPGGGPGAYQVTGVDSQGLAIQSVPQPGHVTRWAANGSTLIVRCQINSGAQVDGRTQYGRPFTTWDQLSDGTWAYDWYLTTPVVATDGYSPGMPHCDAGGVHATAGSWTDIQVFWTDNSAGNATYLISNQYTTRSLPRAATQYDWTGLPPNSYWCFSVASVLNGYQSPWSPAACAWTPGPAWCPSTDPTHPVCDDTGAFQHDAPGYTPETAMPWDFSYDRDAGAIGLGMKLKWGDAGDFFLHYLDGSGTDYRFDSTVPYRDGPGFHTAVDATVAQWIAWEAPTGGTAFDSGYLDFPAVDVLTTAWQNANWQHAVGHGFYRAVGQRQSDGTWRVALQLTSFYEFRDGENFTNCEVIPNVGVCVTVLGADMHRLEIVGLAKDFRSVGTGTLRYTAGGVQF